jgi:hypothetical protein
MARLSVLTDLTGTITRQTLANMWANAAFGGVGDDDFQRQGLSIQLATDIDNMPGDPTPGTMAYNQDEQLAYVYTDVLDDTSVSLWLAIGPDVFECACLAAEPIPAGAIVVPFMDRWVKVARPAAGTADFFPIGVNQSGVPPSTDIYTEGETQASGTWIRVAIDGLPRAWFPKEDAGVSEAQFGADRLLDGTRFVGALRGDRFIGGVGQTSGGGTIVTDQIGQVYHPVTCHSGMSHTYARVKWSGLRKYTT